MQDFKNLRVWREARLLVFAVYHVTAQLPDSERFGFQSQMRRAAVSVASNIAEGSGRERNPDFARFLDYAIGSVAELRCQLDLAANLDLLDRQPVEALAARADRIGRMLHRLRQRVAGSPSQ